VTKSAEHDRIEAELVRVSKHRITGLRAPAQPSRPVRQGNPPARAGDRVSRGRGRRLEGRLAKYKCPKRVLFAAELPRNAMGKVQKNLLRETHAAVTPSPKSGWARPITADSTTPGSASISTSISFG
jgi:acyl-CoA synthetase (AMP-forming)/AMP-acid ligase II